MKKCPYCGVRYPDSVELCPADLNRLEPDGIAPVPGISHPLFQPPDSAAERRFWERMTFRQFAVLLVRIQSVWMIFYAIVDLTYLPSYFVRIASPSFLPHFYGPTLSSSLAVFRVILHVIMAVLGIVYAETILGWLVKDMVPKDPPTGPTTPPPLSVNPAPPRDKSLQTTA
jgi:hypothetical protein